MPCVAAEEMRRRRGGAADKPDRAGDLPGVGRADRGGIGHHLGHLGAGAVPRVHRQKRNLGQIGAHRRGVVGGNAGRPDLLQQHGFEIDQMRERAGQIEDRLAGADPGGLGMVELDLEAGAALRRHPFEKLDRQARRADDRPAHEDGIGRLAIAEPADDRLGLQEIAVGARGEVVVISDPAPTCCHCERSEAISIHGEKNPARDRFVASLLAMTHRLSNSRQTGWRCRPIAG